MYVCHCSVDAGVWPGTSLFRENDDIHTGFCLGIVIPGWCCQGCCCSDLLLSRDVFHRIISSTEGDF